MADGYRVSSTSVSSRSSFRGPYTEYAVDVAGELFRVWQPDATLTDEGASQWVTVSPDHVRVLPAGDDTDASLAGDEQS
jgi:hypothetical protein